jgi:hypothetical protein
VRPAGASGLAGKLTGRRQKLLSSIANMSFQGIEADLALAIAQGLRRSPHQFKRKPGQHDLHHMLAADIVRDLLEAGWTFGHSAHPRTRNSLEAS